MQKIRRTDKPDRFQKPDRFFFRNSNNFSCFHCHDHQRVEFENKTAAENVLKNKQLFISINQ
jgi:hypothetical protein